MLCGAAASASMLVVVDEAAEAVGDPVAFVMLHEPLLDRQALDRATADVNPRNYEHGEWAPSIAYVIFRKRLSGPERQRQSAVAPRVPISVEEIGKYNAMSQPVRCSLKELSDPPTSFCLPWYRQR